MLGGSGLFHEGRFSWRRRRFTTLQKTPSQPPSFQSDRKGWSGPRALHSSLGTKMEHPAPISWLEITSTCLVSSDRAHAKCSAICDGSLCAFWRFATREERARLASKLWNSRSRPSMLASNGTSSWFRRSKTCFTAASAPAAGRGRALRRWERPLLRRVRFRKWRCWHPR